MTAVKSPWIIAFGVVAVVHLVLNGTDASPWDSITKCLLAPLLAAWVIEQKGPRAVVIALILCFLGDLFLELGDRMFVVGMAAFAGAHITFIRFFIARGAINQLRRRPPVLIVYVVAAVGLVAAPTLVGSPRKCISATPVSAVWKKMITKYCTR